MRNRYEPRAAQVAGVISRNPREAVAFFAASSAIMIIFINALFMQPGPHPAPIFARSAPTQAPVSVISQQPMSQPVQQPITAVVPAPLPRPHAERPVQPSRNDPIAQLLAPSNRVLATQRVLTQYGYGQIRPTGVAGPETADAIRKFERSRKLPVTGTLSDQVVRALSDMTGQPIE